MRSRLFIQILLTAIAVVGTVWILRSSQPVGKSAPCKESMDASCEKKPGADKMIWENLSQQFFSTI